MVADIFQKINEDMEKQTSKWASAITPEVIKSDKDWITYFSKHPEYQENGVIKKNKLSELKKNIIRNANHTTIVLSLIKDTDQRPLEVVDTAIAEAVHCAETAPPDIAFRTRMEIDALHELKKHVKKHEFAIKYTRDAYQKQKAL